MNYKNYISFIIFLQLSPFIIPQSNWTVQTSGITDDLYCISAVDNNIAWAAGESGAVIRTIDGGINWPKVDGGNFGNNIIWNIDALDENTAFITYTSVTQTYIYRTTNGGSDWQPVFIQSGGFINDIHVYDNSNGIAYGDPVGGKWTVVRTTNGGTTWNRIPTEPTPNGNEIGVYYNSLSVTDSLHIWFLGSQRVYRSSDAGLTWSSTVTPDYYLSIWFLNDSVGMTSSAINGGLSTDSGINWNSISIPAMDFYTIAGSGIRDFWFPSGPNVYHTIDFGNSWTSDLIFPGGGQIFASDFVTIGNNAIGYVAGTNGIVARYEGLITLVNTQSNNLLEYFLEQNYPNPFNPVTTIKYSVPNASQVSLIVIDALGREIRTLVNDEKHPGNYTVKFDGSDLSSGVYFCVMKADNYINTIKLVLIK
jgi:photosystem II stability/assembly factor-like uncharacterized protein